MSNTRELVQAAVEQMRECDRLRVLNFCQVILDARRGSRAKRRWRFTAQQAQVDENIRS